MSKSSYFDKEAQEALVKGLNLVGNAVRTTLGAGGTTVVIQREDKSPLITKDGVSVAKEINPKDEKVKLGADLAIAVAQKQLNSTGDGPQPLYEKVLTPDGWKLHKELKVGDIINGTNGSLQKVVGIFPKGKKEVFQVTMRDGTYVECCEDHLWSVLETSKNGKITKNKVLSLKEMLQNGIKYGNRYLYSLPTTKVDFPKKDVLLHPYLVGVMLGDGCIREDAEIGIGYKKEKIIDKLKKILPPGIELSISDVIERNYKKLRFKGTYNGKKLGELFDEINLLNIQSINKFIPDDYIYNTEEVRRDILQGLLDTDGTITSRGTFQYSSISLKLIENIRDLCKGLNIPVSITTYKNRNKSFGNNIIYRITQLQHTNNDNKIISVKKLNKKEEMQCIKVSNDDHLYITSGYNLTHNTTTATVLAQSIVNTGISQIEYQEHNVNRTSVRRGIEKARDYVVNKLDSIAKTIETDEDLVNIATVSANGDEKLGKIVAEAYQKVGKAGVVLVEESSDRDIKLEFKEGMTFNKGWTSQFFITNHETQTVEFDKPKVLLTNGKISNFQSLAQLIEPTLRSGQPLVIIAESFDASVTQGLAMNIIRSGGQLKVAAIEAPGYGDRRLDILRDMAIYLNADVGDDPMGISFDAMTEASFGTCDKIIIKKDETIISGGHGDKNAINERIKAIEGLISALKENDQWEKEQLGKRLASLTTGVAVIKVGGASEEEIKELRDRLEDSQFAVKAALEEGYIAGAGNSLLLFSEDVIKEVKSDNSDEELGINIFAKSLKAPFKTILENAGVTYDEVMKEILAKHDFDIGYNARTFKVVNLVEDGIIDPVKVVKNAVLAASSIASVVLTSKVIITEDPKENTGLSLNMMPQPMM